MRRRLSSIFAAALLLALSAQVVSADALVADGDGLAPVAGGRLDLGTICHAETTTATVLVAVRATGHPNNRGVFDNGTTVTMTATVLSGTGLSAATATPTIVMDADWRSQPNQTMAAPLAWDIAATPDTLGRYRGRLEFRAEGTNRLGQVVSRVARMNVIGRVVDCTPPVFADVPADLVVEAQAVDGADVTYVPPTANDAVDGAVAVDCDVPSAARLAMGVTTVSCSAADRRGNISTVTFIVTVADTTAPVMDAMPVGAMATADGATGAVVSWAAPTATDLVDGDVAVACDPAAGSVFPVGSTTVTCAATDAAGNATLAAFQVDVAGPPDSNPQPEQPRDEPLPGPQEPEPVLTPREDTLSGGFAPPSSPPAGAAPATSPPAAALPDTSTGIASTPALALGLLLVGLAALSAAAARRGVVV